jgi:hypothetical protein
VFALRLIRRKSAQNPTDLIRCKFSIDAGLSLAGATRWRIHHFETISPPARKPVIHHPDRMSGPVKRKNPGKAAV